LIQILIDNFLFYDFISMVSFCMTIINICNVFVKCNWYATAAKTKKKRAAGTACGFMGQPLCIGRSKCIINMVAAALPAPALHMRMPDALGHKEFPWQSHTHA